MMTPEEIAIAIDIADESEAAYLESICTPVRSRGETWLDVTPFPDPTDEAIYGAHMRRAIAWLERRRFIEHHPRRKNLVRNLIRITRHDMGHKSLAPHEQ
jgi:hypothetical protein